MANYIVWLDHQEAHIYNLAVGGMLKEHLKKHTHEHSNSHADARGDQENSRFFHEIAAKLNNAEEVLLIGPGLGKSHFKTHLETHHHAQLAKKIVGVETVDHPTEKQVIQVGKKFFKAYDLFH